MSADREEDPSGPAGGDLPSACYFCNESFELGHLQTHLKQCGSILEQCPRRCGAWVQRRQRGEHGAQCGRRAGERARPTHAAAAAPAPGPDHTWAPAPGSAPLDDCVTFLEREVADIKLVLTAESSEVAATAGAARALQARVARLEAAAGERPDDWARRLQEDVAAVQLAVQELAHQQARGARRAAAAAAAAAAALAAERAERERLELVLNGHDVRLRGVQRLEEAIDHIQQSLESERQRGGAELAAAGPSSPVDRLAVLELSLREARAEAAELGARADASARDARALAKSYVKLRSELADFQARVGFGDGRELGSEDGRLIWRIDNFSARMKEARAADAVLCSPLFRTSKYGYTLKAELHLNGIGSWRGRHATATARLLAGPWDALLPWPCDLALRVVLRDQPAAGSQPMDIVKTLELRRKSSSKRHDYDHPTASADHPTASADHPTAPADHPTASGRSDGLEQTRSLLQLKRQYVFFPHASLDKFDYVRNDVMFMEFIVEQ